MKYSKLKKRMRVKSNKEFYHRAWPSIWKKSTRELLDLVIPSFVNDSAQKEIDKVNNPNANCIPFYLNRDTKRKVERYRNSHPGLTFTQAYNKVFNTNYDEPSKIDEYDTSDCKQ